MNQDYPTNGASQNRRPRSRGAGGPWRRDRPNRDRFDDIDGPVTVAPAPAPAPRAAAAVPPAPVRLTVRGRVVLWVVGLVLVWMASQSVVVIRPGERGVLSTMGKVHPDVLGEGTHFVVPFWQQVDRFSALMQTVTQDVEAMSKDAYPVQVRLSVEFRVDSRELPNLLRASGFAALDNRIVRPALLAVPEAVIRQRSAEAVLNGRHETTDVLKAAVTERLARYGLKVEQFDARWTFPTETLDAIAQRKEVAKNFAEEPIVAAVTAATTAGTTVVAAKAPPPAPAAVAAAKAPPAPAKK